MIIRPKSRARLALLCALGLVPIFALMGGVFRYSSVCKHCAKVKSTSEFGIQSWNVVVWQTSKEQESRLSTMLASEGIVQPHEHNWMFAQGGGNGVKCAIGGGRFLARVNNDTEFVAFVRDTWRFGQQAIATNLLAAVLNPHTASSALWRTVASDYSLADVDSAASLRTWLQEHSFDLDYPFEIASLAFRPSANIK